MSWLMLCCYLIVETKSFSPRSCRDYHKNKIILKTKKKPFYLMGNKIYITLFKIDCSNYNDRKYLLYLYIIFEVLKANLTSNFVKAKINF